MYVVKTAFFFLASVLLTASCSSVPPQATEDNAETSYSGKTLEQTFTSPEILSAAERLFGNTAENLAEAIHTIFTESGEPNAYIAGQEVSGALTIGLRYGSGKLVTKAGAAHDIYWRGPTAGWDIGGDAAKVFTLVYNLPDEDAIYRRFPGVEGRAYFIGGVSVNYQRRGDIILVPMRVGVGMRLGANVGYLSYTRERDLFPF